MKIRLTRFSEIIVQGSAPRPETYVIRRFAGADGVKPDDERLGSGFDWFGVYWEADAVARCLRGQFIS